MITKYGIKQNIIQEIKEINLNLTEYKNIEIINIRKNMDRYKIIYKVNLKIPDKPSNKYNIKKSYQSFWGTFETAIEFLEDERCGFKEDFLDDIKIGHEQLIYEENLV